MANVTAVQLLQDGPRNVTVKLYGTLDTADIASTVVVDPALLSTLNGESAGPLATRLIIDRIDFNVEAGLTVNLFWDATTPVNIVSLVNSGDDMEMKDNGGLWNNAGTGVTGKITYTTQGWSAGAILSFAIILKCRKR